MLSCVEHDFFITSGPRSCYCSLSFVKMAEKRGYTHTLSDSSIPFFCGGLRVVVVP